MGSLIFKDKQYLPEDLPFEINYLGGVIDNYSLNFSKSSSNLLGQYYNFLRYGKTGYRQIMHAVMSNAATLEKYLLDSGYFELLTDTKFLPVVVVKLCDASNFTVFDLSYELKKNGWIIPAYTLPPKVEHIEVMRMVIKENFSHDLAEKLISDIKHAITRLEKKKPVINRKRIEKQELAAKRIIC